MGKKLSYIFAALMWLASVYEVALFLIRLLQGSTAETPLIGVLFRQGVAVSERSIALVLTFVFSWVLLDLFFHFLRTYREQSAATVLAGSRDWNPTGITKNTFAAKRAALVKSRPSAQLDRNSLKEILPAAASLDSAINDGLFSHTRALVWALPVIGFIGTAVGLASSIGGFSEALSSKDQQILIQRLGQEVIPGLSSAFVITMAALGAATIGHLCATALHSWSEDVLSNLNATSLALLARVPGKEGFGEDTNWQERLLAEMKNLISRIQPPAADAALTEAGRMLSGSAEALQLAAKVISELADKPYYVTITRDKVPAHLTTTAGGRR